MVILSLTTMGRRGVLQIIYLFFTLKPKNKVITEAMYPVALPQGAHPKLSSMFSDQDGHSSGLSWETNKNKRAGHHIHPNLGKQLTGRVLSSHPDS